MTWIAEEGAWNFAVYSAHANRVTLVLYADDDPATSVLSRRVDYLRNKSGLVWHYRILESAMKSTRFYVVQEGRQCQRQQVWTQGWRAPATSASLGGECR